MDFAAYLDGRWYTFDARNNIPRTRARRRRPRSRHDRHRPDGRLTLTGFTVQARELREEPARPVLSSGA